MNRILHSRLSMFGFTMTMPLIAVAWVASASGTMSGLTLLTLVVVAIGTAAVIFSTWRNAQPTEIIGHVLQHAENPAVVVRPAVDRRAAAQWRP
jgi:hypothetical protein